MIILRSKKSPFANENSSPISFCKTFCSHFNFDDGFLKPFIPNPFCMHLYVSSFLVINMLKDQPIRHLMHQFYHAHVERARGFAPEAYYGSLNYKLKRPPCHKSYQLPFLFSTSDFYEELEKSEGKYGELIEVKSSDKEADLARYLTGKDKQTNIHMQISASIYRAKAARLVAILPEGEKNIDYELFSKQRIEYSSDYIKDNQTKITKKYLGNVLLPYFEEEFKIIFSKDEKTEFIHWFRMQCKCWSSQYKHTMKSEMEELGYKKRNHWRCKQIMTYKPQI